MPNGTLEDRFDFCFIGKAFDLWFLEPHREDSIPEYEPDVISSNKFSNLFHVVRGSQKNIFENFKAHCESFGYVMKSKTHWNLFFFKKIKAQVLLA